MHLDISEVSISYANESKAVVDVSLSLQEGEIGCLLGPSGCGKTSLLRAIAGLQPLHHGRIRFQGKTLSDAKHNTPPEQRQIGMVFQDLALFPHLTLAKNVAFGIQHLAAAERQQRVNDLLQMVSMLSNAETYPHQISGGQQQRIALIRAVAPKPRLLLLDEPFSSQDVELRAQLAQDIAGLLKQENISGFFCHP